jgi:hypothetical protein
LVKNFGFTDYKIELVSLSEKMKNTFCYILFFIVLLTNLCCTKPEETGQLQSSDKEPYVITFAGDVNGFADGTSNLARFSGPAGLAIDLLGNIIVGDGYNNRVRKIDTSGNVATIAGNGSLGFKDGIASSASFFYPAGVVVDPLGNIFVCDEFNHQIRKITPGGDVSTFAGSRSSTSHRIELKYPVAITIDADANLYVADQDNNVIEKIGPDGTASQIGSGKQGYADGNATTASFYTPTGVVCDKFGNVFVADRGNNRIRKIAVDGTVSTIAGSGSLGSGDGISTSATFNGLAHIAVDDSSNLYVTQYEDHKIRKITAAGYVSTFSGTGLKGRKDGPVSTAEFSHPTAITIDKKGNIFITEIGNNLIRKIVIND